ncbi:MAG: hypothetical protein Q8835_02855 [Sweet potato little leaf phytoplasma]|nr:hypothetical protein [Sweet potato little leaf phytoplasma]
MQTRTVTLPSGQTTTTTHKGVVRRLSESEYWAKRDKGLRFKCDEKFTRGHRCKQKELNVFLFQDIVEDNEEVIEVEDEEQVTMQSVEVAEAVELSLNSVIGFSNPWTMKMKGNIADQEIMVSSI